MASVPTLGTVTPRQPPPTGPVWTVVVAGGGGTRYGSAKQFLELAGRTVLEWSVQAARSVSDGVVVVVPAADAGRPLPGADAVVAGGATRAASVRNGLGALPADADVVLVHDAARPAASPQLFSRVLEAVRAGADGVVPGVPVTDSLRARAGGAVDRDALVAVQTPQGFPAARLRAAHAEAAEATDDATLVERTGGTIVIVDGELTNTKLTHPHDRIALERTLGGAGAMS
jgi:2-C-methyl-D-erythritol 4-phosphate cytidylyltransferase